MISKDELNQNSNKSQPAPATSAARDSNSNIDSNTNNTNAAAAVYSNQMVMGGIKQAASVAAPVRNVTNSMSTRNNSEQTRY